MGKYIYQSPSECSRALKLIAEQMDKESESYNALNTAMDYLYVMQVQCEDEKKKHDEWNVKWQAICEIKKNKKQPVRIGDEIEYEEMLFIVTRIRENDVEALCYDGACYQIEVGKFEKTGKNYSNQLADVLTELCADMRGDGE